MTQLKRKTGNVTLTLLLRREEGQLSQESSNDRLRKCVLYRPTGMARYYIVGWETREDVIELLDRLSNSATAQFINSGITPFNEIIHVDLGGHRVTMVFENELSFYCDVHDENALEFVANVVRNALQHD